MLVSVQASGGKTRIAIAALLMLAQEKRNVEETVVVIHPNKLLEEQDDEQWEKVEELLKSSDIKLLRFHSYK